MVQNTLRSRPGSIGCNLSKELPSRAVPIRNYLAILTQPGARTALHVALLPRPAGGPNLIDSESEYQAAGAAVTKRPLRILARVAGPQLSYRAEMYGAAIGAAIASDGDTQYIEHMAVTKCAHRRPTHECCDADIRHKVCDQVQHKRVAAEWIPNHRLETEARNAQEHEQIRRNGEVDVLAKMATRLPVPDYDPRRPEDIVMCGGVRPHCGAEMGPPTEARCQFRRCAPGILAADARGPTYALR